MDIKEQIRVALLRTVKAEPSSLGEAPAYLATEGELLLEQEQNPTCCVCEAGLGPHADEGDLCNACEDWRYERYLDARNITLPADPRPAPKLGTLDIPPARVPRFEQEEQPEWVFRLPTFFREVRQ